MTARLPRKNTDYEDRQEVFNEVHVTRSFSDLALLFPSLLVPPIAKGSPDDHQKDILLASWESQDNPRWWPNRPLEPAQDPPNPHIPRKVHHSSMTTLGSIADAFYDHYLVSFMSLTQGTSPEVAYSARYGIPPQLVSQWLDKGSEDIAEGIDSYFSRFSLDCIRGVGLAVEKAQSHVFSEDPLKYLTHSLGQAFGEEYGRPGVPPSEMSARIAGTAIPQGDQDYLSKELTYEQSTNAQQAAMKAALDAGITPDMLLQHNTNQFPELKKEESNEPDLPSEPND